MQLSLETKALGWALLASFLSVGSICLIASPIQMITGSGPVQMAEASLEIAATPELINQGSEYFGQSCALCHGDDAHGDEGPDLHNLTISKVHIAATIRKGIKGEMPAFGKKYDDHQIAALVFYLKSLR